MDLLEEKMGLQSLRAQKAQNLACIILEITSRQVY